MNVDKPFVKERSHGIALFSVLSLKNFNFDIVW
jgi:hypothetical protein